MARLRTVSGPQDGVPNRFNEGRGGQHVEYVRQGLRVAEKVQSKTSCRLQKTERVCSIAGTSGC